MSDYFDDAALFRCTGFNGPFDEDALTRPTLGSAHCGHEMAPISWLEEAFVPDEFPLEDWLEAVPDDDEEVLEMPRRHHNRDNSQDTPLGGSFPPTSSFSAQQRGRTLRSPSPSASHHSSAPLPDVLLDWMKRMSRPPSPGHFDCHRAGFETAAETAGYDFHRSESGQSMDSLTTSVTSTSSSKRGIRIPGGYPCDSCDLTFSLPSSLDHHKRSHLAKEDRPHGCEECGERFLYPKDVRRHARRRHHGSVERQQTPVHESNTPTLATRSPFDQAAAGVQEDHLWIKNHSNDDSLFRKPYLPQQDPLTPSKKRKITADIVTHEPQKDLPVDPRSPEEMMKSLWGVRPLERRDCSNAKHAHWVASICDIVCDGNPVPARDILVPDVQRAQGWLKTIEQLLQTNRDNVTATESELTARAVERLASDLEKLRVGI